MDYWSVGCSTIKIGSEDVEIAYRFGKRHEQFLFPAGINNYVSSEAPVRMYDAFVETLDFGELGIGLDAGKVANSSYDPKAILKLLVYGYSYGVRSSRQLERETHYNLSFRWLTGGLKPDHKTPQIQFSLFNP